MGVGEAAGGDANETVTKWATIAGGKALEEGFGEGMVGVRREGGVNWLKDGVDGISVCPVVGGRKGGVCGAGEDVLKWGGFKMRGRLEKGVVQGRSECSGEVAGDAGTEDGRECGERKVQGGGEVVASVGFLGRVEGVEGSELQGVGLRE